jgi:hypothetical protein
MARVFSSYPSALGGAPPPSRNTTQEISATLLDNPIYAKRKDNRCNRASALRAAPKTPVISLSRGRANSSAEVQRDPVDDDMRQTLRQG